MRIGSAFAVSAVAALCACGGGGGGGGGGTCNPGATTSVNISSTGISPIAVCVLPASTDLPGGGKVFFNNTDNKQHDIESTSAGCTELNVGPIDAGKSGTASFATTAQKTCTFHDTVNTSITGTVAVTSAPAQGPGY